MSLRNHGSRSSDIHSAPAPSCADNVTSAQYCATRQEIGGAVKSGAAAKLSGPFRDSIRLEPAGGEAHNTTLTRTGGGHASPDLFSRKLSTEI